MKKISEFIEELDSHTIYAEPNLSEDFEKETGMKSGWPIRSRERVMAMIEERGIGGFVDADANEYLSNGYEIANWCAHHFTGETPFDRFHGRGSQFRASVEALKAKGL